MKKCPFCAEEIQDQAIKCRYCGGDLVEEQRPTEIPATSPSPLANTPQAQPATVGKKTPFHTVVLAAAALIVVALGVMLLMSGSSPKSLRDRPASPSGVPLQDQADPQPSADVLSAGEMAQLTDVPAAVLGKAGAGSGQLPEKLPSGTPLLVSDGKPEIVYIGAEFCPYCASERWSVAQALTRFGTFTDLGKSASGPPPEVFPNTPSVSFYGSSYASDYVVFSPIETADSYGNPLQKMTPEQKKLLSAYSDGGGIPFLDVGGLYVKRGTSVSPELLASQGMTTVTQVLDSLADPSSQVGLEIDGSANVIAATICEATGGQPADVCESDAVAAAAARLSGSEDR